MSLVLAIEPDNGQGHILKRIVGELVGADLVLVESLEAAVAVLGRGVPDVILVTALLSPRDEDDLVTHLRSLPGADHLQTHTIPLLSATRTGRPVEEGAPGIFRKFRRKAKPAGSVPGCDPQMFAEEIRAFLRRAAELRVEAASMRQSENDLAHEAAMPSPGIFSDEPFSHEPRPRSDVAAVQESPFAAGESTWASPFEWRSSYGGPQPGTHPSLEPTPIEREPEAGTPEPPDDIRWDRHSRRMASVDLTDHNGLEALRQASEARAEALRLEAELRAEELRREAEAHRLEAERLRAEAEAAAERAVLESLRRQEAEAEAEVAEREQQEELRRLRAEAAAAGARAREEERARVTTEAALAAAVEAARKEERAHLEEAAAEAAGQARTEERRRMQAETAAAAARAREEEGVRLAARAAAAAEHAREEERARLVAAAAAAAQAARGEERRRFEAEAAAREARAREEERAHLAVVAAAAAERAREEERARLEAAAAGAAERARKEERARLQAEAAVAAVRAREEERGRVAAEAAAAVEHAREEERARFVQLAAEAAERARDEERQRFQAEIAAAEARAREAEGARLAVETAAAAARAREADRAAAERMRTEEERDREEERRELETRAMAEVHRAREEERRSLEAELAAERQRTADAIAALPLLPSPDDPGVTAAVIGPLVAPDPFAQFREEYDHVGPAVLRHLPLAAWARTERPHPAAGVPGRAEPDVLRELLEGLALPPYVAEVTYAQGCRIRRVRVPAGPAGPLAGHPQPVILSRRALDEARSSTR